MLLDDRGLQERVARVETLLGEIEALKDPKARSKAAEIVQVLLELYGEGMARMMEKTSLSRTCCSCTDCTPWTWRRE
jgi:hypothetical protein